MELKTEKIWSDYNKDLKRFILSKVKDKDVSNDILQDVFIKVHLKITDLENEDKLKQWIFQITRNTINDYFRKNKFTIDTDKIDLPAEDIEPKNNRQFAKCLTSFIKKLPKKYKEAITLVELNNISQLQLAEKLQISYSGAKSRVQRGRELLKAHFSDCCDVTTDKYGNVVSHKSSCTTCQI